MRATPVGLVQYLVSAAERKHPLELRSPFEGADSIAGGLWLGRDLVGEKREDGIAKLHFGALTMQAQQELVSCL